MEDKMASKQEFEEAFATANGSNIIVRTRSGKEYWVHEDQLTQMDAGLIYGSPIKKHPRAKNDVVWFEIGNVTIVRVGAA
jgi:hypothetical protein